MSDHTPEPWIIVNVQINGYRYAIEPKGRGWWIAAIPNAHCEAEDARTEENTRLIRAAPELLDLVKSLVEELRCCGGDLYDVDVVTKAQELVDKVKGI